jgi:hypothetical protein
LKDAEMGTYVDMIERILGNHKNKKKDEEALFGEAHTQEDSSTYTAGNTQSNEFDCEEESKESNQLSISPNDELNEDDMSLDQMLQQVTQDQADYDEDRDDNDDEDDEDPIASVTFAASKGGAGNVMEA